MKRFIKLGDHDEIKSNQIVMVTLNIKLSDYDKIKSN